MTDQCAHLEWRGGTVPVSTRFDDPYFSLDNGLAETEHVFLAGNDLPERFRGGFQIAELGFGTGLNLLTALRSFRGAGCEGKLHFTSFEAYPMAAQDMIAAQGAFEALTEVARELRPFWTRGVTRFETDDLVFELITGDARDTVKRWEGMADAWFLDGFSPAKNPELWGVELMRDVAGHTAAGGTAATYTAAGHVRRALQDAGFSVSRVPGFGRKRHMTTAML